MLLRWLLLVSCLLIPRLAGAHDSAPSLLNVTELEDQLYNVVWKTTSTPSVGSVAPRPHWPDQCEVISASPVQPEGTGKVQSWRLGCSSLGADGLVGQTIGVSGLAVNQTSAVVLISLLDGRGYQQVLYGEQSSMVVPEQSSGADVATDYAVLGVEHIWGGIDHLLFIFGLLLLVGKTSRLLWTITAFTVGHSITLSLVVLGVYEHPGALVEFAVALSIFVLAVELSLEKKSWLWSSPWWLAGGFGLLHGMGFAGMLAETGVPQDSVPLALMFFNIGVEVGQVSFVLVAIGLWMLLRRWLAPVQELLRTILVYTLGILSAMWCMERLMVVFS